MTRTAKAPAPWRSGFCGINNPTTSHRLCRGAYDNAHPCICPCHTVPEEPMTDTDREVVVPLPDGYHADRLAREAGVRVEDYLPSGVHMLTCAAEDLSQRAMAKDIAKVDWKDAVRMLDQIRHATDLIGSVRDALVMHVYLTGEHGDQEVEGVKGLVRIARGRERKDWEVDRAARAVVDAKMEALEGETPDPLEVVDWLLEVLHVDYARVTPLRGMGLDPKEFCTDRPGKIGVALPPR